MAAWFLRPCCSDLCDRKTKVSACGQIIFFLQELVLLKSEHTEFFLLSQNQLKKEDFCRFQKKTKPVRILSAWHMEYRALGASWCWGRGSSWGSCHQSYGEQL